MSTPPGKLLCRHCNLVIIGDYFNVKEDYYHRMCFKCEKCWTPLVKGYYPMNGKVYCDVCYRTQKGESCQQCQSCRKPITSGKLVKLGEACFHGECFRCQTCRNAIVGDKFVLEQNAIYCPECNVQRKIEAMGAPSKQGATQTQQH